jgi:hypothetical protein
MLGAALGVVDDAGLGSLVGRNVGADNGADDITGGHPLLIEQV